MSREIRVGIDVGGTHTKAVAIDNATHEIVGQSIVMTSHDHELGVAAGVIECFKNCLTANGIKPDDVVFIAHSTTQATNALLEGDVAKVGILGMGPGGLGGILSKKQSAVPDIDLGTGRKIEINHTYLPVKKADDKGIEGAVEQLRDGGAQVLVASQAFGVDSNDDEERVRVYAEKNGMMVSIASDISKLYGLTSRTRTAAINASILPKMMNTANSTESAVHSSGINVPLMIMRGDGGVMDIGEMKKRPVLTMLSGPAASVIGALMYLRASNGIYFEVGGTSTNIGVIKNGRPAVEYAVVGGHRTYVNSLDVTVLGVAGGSMVRAANGKLVDVGPRSAHIAGAKYAVYTPQEEIDEPELEFFAPKAGDPADYVRIRLASGERVTITNSCAANILGYVKDGDYSQGNVESARICMKPLADYLGVSIEECARQILAKSCEKVAPVITGFAEKYKIEAEQISLVGCGGGASALLPFTAETMKLNYSIPEYAEVISSIGVALAMVRDVVERVVPNPTGADIVDIKKEAKTLAIKSGAVPDSIEVQIEIDPQTNKITAIALGSTEVQTTDLLKACDEKEARTLAAASMNLTESDLECPISNDLFYVFTAVKNQKTQLRLLDKKGFIKVQRGDAKAVTFTGEVWEEEVEKMWNSMLSYKNEMERTPDLYLCIEGKVLDFANTISLEQLKIIMGTEFVGLAPEENVILIGARSEM
ncbi:hydantoinase/oxoprolinase family protein [Lacrimispora celerecrescens]|uniref:N-methylhydantoinase A/oxoprolinase/acetone carboxylase beta subunit n=1 Tax=[Clostridium] celerecrescens 18A TaxID=1286362 RepID=A0A2M8Z4V7_9FIRM|nr:hydantoinase/oxoprolinase family protein [Lacrimispora celerecrescens]PJJ28479.1 N-methylhydantoinase A/oxoprolinase/acetone carboxylase beta subunit [[Clostridium] celerecrescens 18A]